MHGQVCNEINFIVNGVVGAFYFKNEVDVMAWLIRENDLIISINSFFSQRPGFENIELLEDSSLISLSYQQLVLLSEERAYSIRMHTTRERYDLLIKNDSWIFQRAYPGTAVIIP